MLSVWMDLGLRCILLWERVDVRSRESEGLGGFNACVFVSAIAYAEGGVSAI